MPKTRQQRMAQEQAGHAPSPPQMLPDKSRGPRRTRVKFPSANDGVAEGPVAPSQPLTAPDPEAPRALVHVWVNKNRHAYDPNHDFAMSSARVPELVFFVNKLRDHGTQHSVRSSFSSATQVTPSLNQRHIAANFQISGTESQALKPSTPMEPHPASSVIVPPFKETSLQMETPALLTRIEQASQQFLAAMAPLSTPVHVRSPLQETDRRLTPHNSRPAGIEAPSKQAVNPLKFASIHQPVNTMSQSVRLTHALHQAVSTSTSSEAVHKRGLNEKMPHQKISQVAKIGHTRPTSESGSPLKRKLEASGATSRKKRAISGKQSEPPLIKQKSSRVLSDPKMSRARRIHTFFCNYRNLPAYTADGEVRYGVVKPSDDHVQFPDEVPTNPDSNITNDHTTQDSQASGSSAHGRIIRPKRSIKRRYGFSPLTSISERSEATPPVKPAKIQPPMRVPSRLFDRMNANKRKRWTSPEPIHNPKEKSRGLDKMEFCGNAEEDENQVGGQQPAKVRRTSNSHNFSSQGAANSIPSEPCTGRESINPRPAIPVTNKAGSFKVPSPGDSDWSNSESEEEGSFQTATAPSSIVTDRASLAAGRTFEADFNSSPAPTSRPRFTAFEDWLQSASPSVASALEQIEVDPNMAGAGYQHALANNTIT